MYEKQCFGERAPSLHEMIPYICETIDKRYFVVYMFVRDVISLLIGERMRGILYLLVRPPLPPQPSMEGGNFLLEKILGKTSMPDACSIYPIIP